MQTSIFRRDHGRLNVMAMALLAVIVVIAAMPSLASAQNPPGSGAPPGGYQGGGNPMGSSGSGMQGGAQGNLQGGGMNNNQVQMTVTALMAGINLTNAQQKSVNSIRDSYAPQIQNAQSTNNMQLVQQLVRQRSTALRNVLTTDQQSTFDNNVQTIRADMNNNQGNGVQY